MASRGSVFTIGQRFDKKVTITLQRSATRRSSTTQQEQTRNSQSTPNPPYINHSIFQCKAPVCSHVAGCTANAETSDSGARRGSYHPHEHFEHMKVLDASRSTFNKIGHDQYNLYNCYINFVDHHYHNHFGLRETLNNPDPEMNSEIVSDNCKPTRIESTTTFRTTNVSVAQHFADLGVPGSSSEISEDSIFAVKSVRYTFFSDPT